MFIRKIKNYIKTLNLIYHQVENLNIKIHKVQESLGRLELRQLQDCPSPELQRHEFRVFSQWGEDGILQYLINTVSINNRIFVEFGVQDYREANTRFLLINNNWSGLVLDGDLENIKIIKNDPIYWQYNLKAVSAFITTENINQILTDNGIQGEIGLLSIDIDGNDYWVWQAIDVINPAIVVVEYNFRLGFDRAITIPYHPDFVRTKAHYSNLYFGASLPALCLLAEQKGYAFVGCNSAGINAFFVRQDLKPQTLPGLSVTEGYVAGKFRESRNEVGELIFLTMEAEQALLKQLPWIEVNEVK